jgi:hypothetical protein
MRQTRELLLLYLTNDTSFYIYLLLLLALSHARCCTGPMLWRWRKRTCGESEASAHSFRRLSIP